MKLIHRAPRIAGLNQQHSISSTRTSRHPSISSARSPSSKQQPECHCQASRLVTSNQRFVEQVAGAKPHPVGVRNWSRSGRSRRRQVGAKGAPSNGVQAAAPGLAVIQLQTVCGLAGAQRHGTARLPDTGRAENTAWFCVAWDNAVSLTCGPENSNFLG